jgi:1-acyl-sn-glycerol-3-phosphate acyltransferase
MAGILDSLLGVMSNTVQPDALRRLQSELRDALDKAPLDLNEFGFDPYGLHPDEARQGMLPAALLYRYYFRVETFGIDRVPEGRVLLIGNHAGQFAYDGMMLSIAMLLEASPPRLCRAMGEYFLFRLPWVGKAGARMGTMVGTPPNCVHMLENEQCVMVFPEGARGANKPFHKRYQLQRFGQGFMRLALQTDTPIVPVGIVGSEEQQPGLANLESVGHALSLPSLPITISMPWLGIFGPMVALPTKYRMHFGEPLYFEGDGDEEDDAIQERVDVVKGAMDELLATGRAQRTGIVT